MHIAKHHDGQHGQEHQLWIPLMLSGLGLQLSILILQSQQQGLLIICHVAILQERGQFATK